MSGDDDGVKRLREEATRVRRAIEQTERDERTAGNLASFPRQCCDHGMSLLALHLSRLGFSGLKRAKGERRPPDDYPVFHVWLRWKDVLLDITADQFGEGLPPVVVDRRSPWHEAWKPRVETVNKRLLTLWLTKEGGIYDVYRAVMAALHGEARP
jgi:hypothetical protein